MDITPLINAVIDREGGYSNNPDDAGGPTNFGITQAVARQQGYAGDMRALPRDEAVAIYMRLYWLKPGYDAVATRYPALAARLFDAGVNMGPVTATGFLQRALNALNRGGRDYGDIAADGALGAATLAALDSYRAVRGAAGEGVLVKAVEALRGARYIELAEAHPADETFLYGWLANRVA